MSIDQSLDLRLSSPLDRIVTYTATILFALTIVFATTQVVVRIFDVELAGIPFHWTEPLSRFALIVGTYLGAAVASRNNEHIQMEIVTNWVRDRRPGVANAINVVASVVIIGFLAVALRGTLLMADSTWHSKFGSVAVVTSGMIYAGIAVGLGLMTLYELGNLVDVVRNWSAERGGDR